MIKNKFAIITGCNRGIGKSILRLFAGNGANIFACARTIDQNFKIFCKNLSKKYNVKIYIIKLDLLDLEQIKNASVEILKISNKIDILVNNAGIVHNALFLMTPLKKFQEQFNVNFFSPIFFTQLILKNMIKNKSGNIINISSSAAHECNEGRSAYASSKAAIITFSKVLSKELAKFNIRINVISPGLTETEMMKISTDHDTLKKTIDRIPLKRIATTNEIANTALFLSSEMSSYITGQVLRVDGGM
jgi:3-oxoacyl-[acyl-carrier protein] reductase